MAKCIAPIQIVNPKFGIKKNSTWYMEVPCGKCPNCLADRRADWSLRLKIELDNSLGAHFITLTYSDENMNYNENGVPSVSKKEMQLYIKRLRKRSINKLRYYAVGEYGTKTKRPHYHILLFNLRKDQEHIITDSWNNKGFTKVGNVTPASIHYVTKYHVNRTHTPESSDPSFALMSRNPGIGANYVNEMQKYHQDRLDKAYYTDLGGQKRRLPRYLKDKLYNKAQRSILNDLNEKRKEQLEYDKHLNHQINNHCKNYYELEQEEKENVIRQFKEKINKNDLF